MSDQIEDVQPEDESDDEPVYMKLEPHGPRSITYEFANEDGTPLYHTVNHTQFIGESGVVKGNVLAVMTTMKDPRREDEFEQTPHDKMVIIPITESILIRMIDLMIDIRTAINPEAQSMIAKTFQAGQFRQH